MPRLRIWLPGFFKRGGDPAQADGATIDKLHSVNRQVIACNHSEGKIGQLVVERDFLKRTWNALRKDRSQMCIERNHPKVSVRRQCQMFSLSRSNLYYAPRNESAETLRFMKLIDKQFLETPWYGSRQPLGTLLRNTLPVNEWHDTCSDRTTNVVAIGPLGETCRSVVSHLMRLMRLVPIYQTPNTSKKHPQHKIHPYLLRGLTIDRSKQVLISRM